MLLALLFSAPVLGGDPGRTGITCPASISDSAASTFGCFSGMAREQFQEFKRESMYVPMRDGTRLAVDVYQPAIAGVAASGRFPVVVTYSRYWRATERADGSVKTELGVLPPGRNSGPIQRVTAKPFASSGVENLVRHGYIYVRAEARGTGASFGRRVGDMSGVEARDGYDLIEWAAAQSWSTGRVGMRGHSYPGMAQHLTASTAPPHLVAIFPGVAPFDEYQSSWAGTGILRKFGLAWLAREAQRDGVVAGSKNSHIDPADASGDQVARVDGDVDGHLRAAAREERRKDEASEDPTRYFTVQSPAAGEMIRAIKEATGPISMPDLLDLLYSSPKLAHLLDAHPETRTRLLALGFYRDASAMLVAPQSEGPNNLATLVPLINRSRIATYDWGGWIDFASVDTTLWHANNRNQTKLTMGPWAHGWNEPNNPREDSQYLLLQIEELRWFDYWLKGSDNDVMREPAVHYAVIEAPQRWSWRSSTAWPPPGSHPVSLYLSSATAGILSWNPPPAAKRIPYRIDYTATLGEHTRHHEAIGLGPLDYGDLNAHAKHGLLFESAPLEHDVVIAGHPVMVLELSSSAPDVEVDAYLESVDAHGRPMLLTEGVILASHRTLGNPPYDNLGLPWLDSREAVVRKTPPLRPDAPSELTFAFQPVAARFGRGERIRLVLTGADAHTNLTIPRDPPPEIEVWSSPSIASHLVLPMMPDP